MFNERMGQPGRIDCYLFYVMGKYCEKVISNVEQAIEWYQKGVDAVNLCHKVQWFGNESWKIYCEKKKDKLIRRKDGAKAPQLKWMED